MAGFQDPASIPSYSAMTVAGNFTISFYLPLELDSSGYCSMPLMNASALPTLQINLAAAATVYSTQPTGATTVAVQVDEDYWAAPINQPDLGPPDVGSSAQWSQSQAPQGVPSASYARLNSQRTGTLIHTIIAVLRDSTGARVAGFPTSDLQFSLDGVPVTYELLSEHKDKQYEQFGLTPETGVLVWSFRDSVQSLVGSADTHDCLLSTTPATLLEVVGTWGTISNAPGTLQLYTGELWPVSGIPYTHLAQ
jgi:hypothetical protein